MKKNQHHTKPFLIAFEQIGQSDIGYISVAQYKKQIPFEIKRIFWTYYTPQSIVRGKHAHYETEQVLIAVAGEITLITELVDGALNTFVLDKPDKCVYIPALTWHTMQYSHNAVQMVLASTVYLENDYIRDYSKFKNL